MKKMKHKELLKVFPELKDEIIELVIKGDLSSVAIARYLNISEQTIGLWVGNYIISRPSLDPSDDVEAAKEQIESVIQDLLSKGHKELLRERRVKREALKRYPDLGSGVLQLLEEGYFLSDLASCLNVPYATLYGLKADLGKNRELRAEMEEEKNELLESLNALQQ